MHKVLLLIYILLLQNYNLLCIINYVYNCYHTNIIELGIMDIQHRQKENLITFLKEDVQIVCTSSPNGAWYEYQLVSDLLVTKQFFLIYM